jgi:hypothetical protein
MIALVLSATLLMFASAPAFAGYGALAYDQDARKYGLSSDEASQGKADDVATKECGSDKCKIIFRTGPRQCGAIATEPSEAGTAWGGGKGPQRAAAELDAVNNCQKRTKGQCKVREAVCNR